MICKSSDRPSRPDAEALGTSPPRSGGGRTSRSRSSQPSGLAGLGAIRRRDSSEMRCAEGRFDSAACARVRHARANPTLPRSQDPGSVDAGYLGRSLPSSSSATDEGRRCRDPGCRDGKTVASRGCACFWLLAANARTTVAHSEPLRLRRTGSVWYWDTPSRRPRRPASRRIRAVCSGCSSLRPNPPLRHACSVLVRRPNRKIWIRSPKAAVAFSDNSRETCNVIGRDGHNQLDLATTMARTTLVSRVLAPLATD